MPEARETLSKQIPRRALGRTGIEVCALGLGGYHLGLVKSEREAVRIVQEAVDAGITFLDNAWEYHDGRSETIMGRALSGGRRARAFLMTKVCTHGRGRREALRQLEQSLRRLRTDHLDLWQVHEVVYENDPERHAAPGGALVGDSAGFYDPFTGEGVTLALRSAELAAKAALRSLRHAATPGLLWEYEQARAAATEDKFRLNRLLQRIVAWPSLSNAMARRLARRPDLADQLVGIAGDLVPARSALRPAFLLELLGI